MGLYYKLGFHSAFPSLILEVPAKFETCKTSEDNVNGCDGNFYQLEIYSKIPKNQRKMFLEKIEQWTRHDLNGISYRNDLEMIKEGGGEIIIISQENEPLGFLAYYSIVFLHLWGAIKPNNCQKEVLLEGIRFFRDKNPDGEVLLEINTRYQNLADLLSEKGFKIRKSVNRMLLNGFEGDYLEKSADFVMRAWHA